MARPPPPQRFPGRVRHLQLHELNAERKDCMRNV
jgi:hypothetical protein